MNNEFMRIAYLDIASGIAGDMMLAALVDAGASRDDIESRFGRWDCLASICYSARHRGVDFAGCNWTFGTRRQRLPGV